MNKQGIAKEILHQIPRDHHYHYDIMRKQHIESTVKMFTKAFCDSEPMTKYVDMDYPAFSVFANKVAEKTAETGLSIVAMDGKKVIACALLEDIADPIPLDVQQLSPKFKYIFSLLEDLTGPFLQNKTFPAGYLSHLFITAVDEKYRGLGLSKQVNFRAMALAASKGYYYMISELTNPLNTKGITHHLQFEKKLLRYIAYNDYIHDGIKPFAGLAEGASGYIWALQPHLNEKPF